MGSRNLHRFGGPATIVALGLLAAACQPAGIKTAAPSQVTPAHAPRVSISSLDALPTPLPLPYDDQASAAQTKAAIDQAFAAAQREDERVIVDLGGNWCSWCRMLSGVMALPEVKPFLDANFVILDVGVSSKKGLTDQNTEVLQRFGLQKIDGTPWLIVAEPDGKVLASSYEVTDDDHHTPQAMVDWLAQWAKHSHPDSQKAAI